MQSNPMASGAGLGASLMMDVVIIVVSTLIVGYPLYVMAQKTNNATPWFAFIPILNIITMIQIAGKEIWWIILCLIPCVNFVVFIILWMAIAERMNKPSWLGILTIVPVLNLVIPWYLALG